MTVVQTYARYQKKPGATSKWKEGNLIRKKKRFRVTLVIVGLDDELVMAAKSQIQNQMGCCCSLGSLDYAECYDSYGRVDPLADNGSKIIATQIAAHSRVLTNIMTLSEAVMPLGCRRRCLRENLSYALHGNRVWRKEIKNVDEQPVECKSKEQGGQGENCLTSGDCDLAKDFITDATVGTDCSSSSASSTRVEQPESPMVDIFGEEYTPSDEEEDLTKRFVENWNICKHDDELAGSCVIS